MDFDIEKYAHCFKTNPDEAYFWHGETKGTGGHDVSMQIAKERSGKTLEMCMIEHRAELEKAGVKFNSDIRYGDTEQENINFWRDCSQSFAAQARGRVHVIEGTDTRPCGTREHLYTESVWADVEKPILMGLDNYQVYSITAIDPATGRDKGIIYDRTEIVRQELISLKREYMNLPKNSNRKSAIEFQYKQLKYQAERCNYFDDIDDAIRIPNPDGVDLRPLSRMTPAERIVSLDYDFWDIDI